MHFETFYEGLGRWFEVHAYPAEEGLAIYVAEITEKKNIELAVRTELESQVAAKTKELAERNRDLESSDAHFGARSARAVESDQRAHFDSACR